MLILIALLAAAPAKKTPVKDTAQVADFVRAKFAEGDLSAAQSAARDCIKTAPKVCKPLNTWVAEYAWLYGREVLTPEQANQLLTYDAKISPKVQGELTKQVVERYVSRPFQNAQSLAQGNAPAALKLLTNILIVDPKHEEARALYDSLRAPPDAGP